MCAARHAPHIAVAAHPRHRASLPLTHCSLPAVTPTADAFLGSPVRSRPSASLCSPVPPPSAVKREVNEAAMALTWLAEALVGPEATSPQPAPRHTAAAAALLSADRTTGGLRGRRAASQRYSLMLQELAADEEGPRQKTPRFAGASDGSRSARRGPRTSDVHVGATLSNRKPKVYTQVSFHFQSLLYIDTAVRFVLAAAPAPLALPVAAATPRCASDRHLIVAPSLLLQNSRVGRAMASIEHFIHAQQAEYESTTGNGVPERVIRQEYGNNPDTSKALRFLVAEKKIVRGGQGGRRDPFSYKMAPGYIYVPLPPVEDDAHDTSAAAGYDQEEAGDFSPAASTEQDLSAGEIAFTPAPGAAAMATLAAFSAGKWPQQLQAGGRRGAIQPRLSLNMSDPLLLNTAAGFAAGSALTHTDMETTTAADRPQLAGCKRSASTHSSLTTPAPASGQGPAKRLAAGAGPAGLAAAAVMGPGVGQAALDLPTPSSAGLDLSCAGPPSTQDAAKLTSWTAQLPAAQTLATASPAPAALPGACSVATPASAGLSVPSVQAAYLMQLQAQLFWQQQKWMAQQGQGRADAQSAAATMEQAHT